MSILNKLFGKKTKPKKKIVINVIEEGVLINDKLITLPVELCLFEEYFGKPCRVEKNESNSVMFWDDYGIKAFEKDNTLDNIMFFFDFWDEPLVGPKNLWQETILIKGEDYKTAIKIKESDYLFHETFVGATEVVLALNEDTKEIITLFLIAKKEKQRKPKTNKYKYQKIAGEKILFEDFNFKLAVIQELMYDQELLLPKFDVYEFVEEYRKRDIDIDDEGYEPIKEVVNYFKKLEIDQSLAEHITDIYQDGGNDVYMNIIPFWDGEDDAFDITNYEDIKHFPNLKTMTLFSQDDTIIEGLKEKGIDVNKL